MIGGQFGIVPLVKSLESRGILEPEFAAKLCSLGNINACDKNGETALHHAADFDALDAVKSLINEGAINLPSPYGETPMHVAALQGNLSVIKYLISFFGMKVATETDFKNRNILHFAAKHNQGNIIAYIMQNDELNSLLNVPDLYGRTPLDFALQNENDGAIYALMPNAPDDVTQIPGYGIKLKNLKQTNLNRKLYLFQQMRNRKAEDFLDMDGNCGGWSFLFLIYASVDREDEFYDILSVIEAWDETAETLQETQLPASLRSIFKNREELFEQVLNDLILFQFTTKATNALKLMGWGQAQRVLQYNMMKDATRDRTLRHLFCFVDLVVTKTQLVEMLELFSQYRGASIEFLGTGHVASLQITKEGKYKYYDSNLRKKTGTYDTAESLAEHIIKFWYMPDGSFENDTIRFSSINAYKFYEKDEIVPEMEETVHEKDADFSPNNFTKLHQAVLRNDLDTVRYELTHNPLQLFFLDCHNASPIQMAIRLQNRACLQLFKETQLLEGRIACDINYFELEQSEPGFFTYLLSEGWLKLEDYDHYGQSLLHCSIGYLNKEYAMGLLHNFAWDINKGDIYGDTPLISACAYRPDSEIIDAFFARKDLDINKPNLYGITPLMAAIIEDNTLMVHRLLEAGASLEPLDHAMKSVFDYAKEPHIIRLLEEAVFNRLLDATSKLMIFSSPHSQAAQSLPIDTLNNQKRDIKAGCSVQL
ncbi:ankyrin repeat domain-containing protein [Candidatus Berkiella aquae]|uniref:Ankyrin repeat domain-containing protein n=1 Tax=Candidatus Berkiella aquae TaxID=295108 RepID=A0A0Q9Z0Y5_9GAMM|nr:ankyrin repeat domain-containing protein [Candidatus Berkiella aquae]MCS5711933.1 ankyrin repeat domain-containing protein [Candidatus Berkiella aquae]